MKQQGMKTNFHVMAKPIGPICNLDCTYCYYLEKEGMFQKGTNFRMKAEILEAYILQYIQSQRTPEVTFAWQGGEPTLLGLEYFQRIVALQKKHSGGRKINNTLQTNGTMLNDDWCRFLRAENFLVGLSIDGPREIHDTYRVDKGHKPTFDRVMEGLNLLKAHQVEFNTLTVVSAANVGHSLRVYDFLREIGSGYIQFIPLVERVASAQEVTAGRALAEPPNQGQAESPVTSWSVPSEGYGDFLIAIFNAWVRRDVGRIFVQMFDVSLGIWSGRGAGLCLFLEDCGEALALEHNGELYSCDHFVYPRYKLGNIMNESIGAMVNSSTQREFGKNKSRSLPRHCRECAVRFACNGECPKHRFLTTPDGEQGLNYLCAGYKKFFTHIDPYMRTMSELLHRKQSPAGIMSMMPA
jgi:uncharacterized protein